MYCTSDELAMPTEHSAAAAPLPLLTNVCITDRLWTGMHVRFVRADGWRRSVWVPKAALAGPVEEAAHRIAPTDGGRPLGLEVIELIEQLRRAC